MTADNTSQNPQTPARVIYRDPTDIEVNRRLSFALLSVIFFCVCSMCANVYLYWRRPDRIVVDRSSGQVITVDNRTFGDTPSASMMPDRLTTSDALFAVRKWTDGYYGINPANRAADIERCIRLMVPGTARDFAARLGQERRLETERKESHQAVWTIQSEIVDPRDNFSVRVIGTQKLTKVVDGKPIEVTRQIEVTFKLVADSAGRTDENLRSGFRVARLEDREIGGAQ